jgi:hypothetical protein
VGTEIVALDDNALRPHRSGQLFSPIMDQELTDLAKLRRPVAWLACFGGQRWLLSRFSLELPTWFGTGGWARLFKCADAQPFIPVIGNLSPFVLVRILT